MSAFKCVQFIAGTVVAGALLFSSGCSNSGHSAANAPLPPATLSEPVRPLERTTESPAIPATRESAPAVREPAKAETLPNPDVYTAQRPGESKELPVFVPPTTASAPVPAAPVVQSAPVAKSDVKDGSGRYHVLAKGETIFAISRTYHVKPQQILAANNFKDPNHLAVGTKVYIPN